MKNYTSKPRLLGTPGGSTYAAFDDAEGYPVEVFVHAKDACVLKATDNPTPYTEEQFAALYATAWATYDNYDGPADDPDVWAGPFAENH